jgi:metal-responsive CopG/Arc/MetJ family transcriptional regulator
MDNGIPKLVIPVKRYTAESTVVSFRLPKDMLQEVDKVAASTGRTRNEVLSLFVEFALEHLDTAEEAEQKPSSPGQVVRLIK